jgi:hypothetical protein
MTTFFEKGRKIVISTQHKKEQVIAPFLSQHFQVCCFVHPIDTDQFGTFTGEIERLLSPVEAARQKCALAIQETGCDVAISSEGSFGAHPFLPFSSANEELVLLVDQRNDIEIQGRALSTETNLSGRYIASLSEAYDFAEEIGFPSHAVILRETKNQGTIFTKGLQDEKVLRSEVRRLLKRHSTLWIETDMRASFNPTRMKVIEQATKNLIERMKSSCPSCFTPGFWIQKASSGLPCSWCNNPTKSTLYHEYACLKCPQIIRKDFPFNKHFEDPTYCDFCNP